MASEAYGDVKAPHRMSRLFFCYLPLYKQYHRLRERATGEHGVVIAPSLASRLSTTNGALAYGSAGIFAESTAERESLGLIDLFFKRNAYNLSLIVAAGDCNPQLIAVCSYF